MSYNSPEMGFIENLERRQQRLIDRNQKRSEPRIAVVEVATPPSPEEITLHEQRKSEAVGFVQASPIPELLRRLQKVLSYTREGDVEYGGGEDAIHTVRGTIVVKLKPSIWNFSLNNTLIDPDSQASTFLWRRTNTNWVMSRKSLDYTVRTTEGGRYFVVETTPDGTMAFHGALASRLKGWDWINSMNLIRGKDPLRVDYDSWRNNHDILEDNMERVFKHPLIYSHSEVRTYKENIKGNS